MKQLLLFLICSFASLTYLYGQDLYGTTSNGVTGTNAQGTICKFVPGTSALTAAYNFLDPNPDGKLPLYTQLVQAGNGRLYGMTHDGGSYNDGTIFFYNPATGVYTKVFDFNGNNGANPSGSLIQATNGKLYGFTTYGGSTGNGTVFSFDPATNAYAKLKDLDSANGIYPNGSWVQASNGKLYGMTAAGGSRNFGTIVSFNPATAAFARVKDFDSTNGGNPYGSLMQASNGKLYGMTTFGGSGNYGTIFSFDPSTSAYVKLVNFNNANGANPYGGLMQASAGTLYGVTFNGGTYRAGVLFSFNPTNNSYSRLYNFNDNDVSGSDPYGTLMEASNGRLYGLTNFGGINNKGVIFSFNTATTTYNKLLDFDGANGGNPHGSFVQATDGKLYAMTRTGGSTGTGILFSFAPNGNTYTKLKAFGTVINGANVVGGLAKDASGMLYGMFAEGGGVYGLGGIYAFNPATSAYNKLIDFNGDNGSNPRGSLSLASNGKLYGMTTFGGGSGVGVLFSLDPGSQVFTKLKDFDGVNGSRPYGSLTQASNGKLYGMTYNGGTDNYGTIFSFNPSNAVFTRLFDFNYDNGAYPYGSLVQATNGKLYGLFSYGGFNGIGGIFSFDPATSTYTVLKDFTGVDGAFPHGSLVQASNGKLYGTTYSGGSSGVGVLFSYDPATNAFAKLQDFSLNVGSNPHGSLTQASNGKLYGMTTFGGNYDYGTTFSYYPSTATFAKVADFTGLNGRNPMYTYFTLVSPAINIKINNASVQEGNSGTTTVTFKVTLSQASTQMVTVDYATKNGTAKAPGDYNAASGTLTLAPGVKQQQIHVLVNGDNQVESDEKFKVLLSNALNAAIKDSIGVGTILNDDGAMAARMGSTADQSHTPAIQVFPVPATSFLNVQLTGFTGKVQLQLLDLQNRMIKKVQAQAVSYPDFQQQLELSGIAAGTYLLVVQDEKGARQTAKVVIIH